MKYVQGGLEREGGGKGYLCIMGFAFVSYPCVHHACLIHSIAIRLDPNVHPFLSLDPEFGHGF